MLKKHFLLLSMLQTVVLLKIFVEPLHFFLGFFDEYKAQNTSIDFK